MQWTLTQLRTFVAVAEQGTMSAAAGRLGYTPGAVSQHVSALSRAVGSPVVSPRGRSVVLTETGRALLPRARAIIAAEAQAEHAMRGASAATTVTVGVFGSASVAAMKPASARLAGQGIDVQTTEVDVEEMQEAVASGLIDVGIGMDYLDARLPPRRGVHMRPVRRERLSVAVGPDGLDALLATADEAELPSPASAPAGGARVSGERIEAENLRRTLNSVPWILPPADSSWGRAFRLACRELGVKPREKHLVTDSAVALAMAASGLGVTLATPYLMLMAPANVHILPRTICGSRDIVILTSTDAPLSPAAATVVKVLTDIFSS